MLSSNDAPIRDFANYPITDTKIHIIAEADNQADIYSYQNSSFLRLYFDLILWKQYQGL